MYKFFNKQKQHANTLYLLVEYLCYPPDDGHREEEHGQLLYDTKPTKVLVDHPGGATQLRKVSTTVRFLGRANDTRI
jgi:hypothetical protein